MRKKALPANENDPSYKTPSLCWECARACGGANCPWADDLAPVKDWICASDSILYCPRFIKGRNSSELTDEQIESTSTNTSLNSKMCRLQTKLVKDEHNRVIDKYYECPICGDRYENRMSSCTNPECRATYLYDKSAGYTINHTNIQLRANFLKDYGEDFPKSKLMTEVNNNDRHDSH